MARLTDEHIRQIANTKNMALGIVDTSRAEGSSMEAIAEGLMEGAISALAHDRDLFQTVLKRFLDSYRF